MAFLQNILGKFFGTQPVCGVPDTLRMAAEPNRWGITNLKWFVESRPVGVGITIGTYDAEVAKAFSRWAAVCSLKFEQTWDKSLANIILRTARGQEYGFPPRTGIVANAHMPLDDHFNGQLFLTLNADTVWVLKQAGKGGVTLLPILVHEAGHNLGLFHSTRFDQAMSQGSPFDTPQSEDIQRIQALYGGPAVSVCEKELAETKAALVSANRMIQELNGVIEKAIGVLKR